MDKRIIKTKHAIKHALIDLLGRTPFEKITVTEICRAAEVSRITFYTYYSDKYALVDEMFADDMGEAETTYRSLQRENNPAKAPIKSYRNLLTCIFSVFEQDDDIFTFCLSSENPYLHSAGFSHVKQVVEEYVSSHENALSPKHPSALTAALVCNGLFGLINECSAQGMAFEETKACAFEVFDDLLASPLFTSDALIG